MAAITSIRPVLRQTDSNLVRRRLLNQIFTGLIICSAFIAVVVLVFIIGYVTIQGAPALNLAFFTERPLPFGEVGGGVAPAILGSLMMLVVASLIGVPVGLGTAVYLVEYGNQSRLAETIQFTVDLIAGLPSIAVGVFVWSLLVRRVIGHYSGLAGAFALAIIMIPIVARTAVEILRLVPDTLREAALALGTPRWRTILRVVLPTARNGLITGTVLALARAGGETAPLLLTALGNQFFNFDLRQPTAALPIQMYNYAVGPYDDWHTKAWGAALVLILIIGIFSLLTRLVVRQRGFS